MRCFRVFIDVSYFFDDISAVECDVYFMTLMFTLFLSMLLNNAISQANKLHAIYPSRYIKRIKLITKAEYNMDLLFWIILIIIGGFFIARILPAKGVNSIDTTELKTILKDKNKQFIDVRSPGEFASRKVKPFKNIPLQQIRSQVDTIDRSKEIILICQSGMRSMQAARVLKKSGFEKITNVKGGIGMM